MDARHQRGMFAQQSGMNDPERRVSKAARPSPGKTPTQTQGEGDDVVTGNVEPPPQEGYDESADAGITQLPPAEEKHQQEDLPPRGSRKKNYHA